MDTRTSAGAPALRVMLVGDLILDEPNPDTYFEPSRALLHDADVAIGHVEVPHTTRGTESTSDIPAPPADPEHLAAVARAGFHVATLAGNHIFDAGVHGVLDTVSTLHDHGIATAGAGAHLADARQPAILTRGDVTIGVLSYNCVGPRDSWASDRKPGCAFIKVLTHYELDYATPGGPPTIYTFADPVGVERMQADIDALATTVDIVVVALHKGVGHTPAALAMYERPLAHAAIHAGAHIIVGHHAHITRGIEVYRGRPIFHGLGNFVTVTRALTVEGNASAARKAWAERRKVLFGFEPDPDSPTYPFHPESRNALVALVDVSKAGIVRAGFIPCWIDNTGTPHPVAGTERGRAVADYLADITRRAGLATRFRTDDDGLVWCALTE